MSYHNNSEFAKRQADRDFMARLHAKSSEMTELEQMLRDHVAAPQWKRIAIRRAIARLQPRPLSWVMDLGSIHTEMIHKRAWALGAEKHWYDSYFQTVERLMLEELV